MRSPASFRVAPAQIAAKISCSSIALAPALSIAAIADVPDEVLSWIASPDELAPAVVDRNSGKDASNRISVVRLFFIPLRSPDSRGRLSVKGIRKVFLRSFWF